MTAPIPLTEPTSKAEMIARAKEVNGRLFPPSPPQVNIARIIEERRKRKKRFSELSRRDKLEAYIDRLRLTKEMNARKRAAIGRSKRQPLRVIARVARRHGFDIATIQGQRRDAAVIRARLECLSSLDKAFPGKSLPWLAHHMHRDHTSILHNLRKLGRWPR